MQKAICRLDHTLSDTKTMTSYYDEDFYYPPCLAALKSPSATPRLYSTSAPRQREYDQGKGVERSSRHVNMIAKFLDLNKS